QLISCYSCIHSSDIIFFFSSRTRHTRCLSDWSSDVCSSDLCSAESRICESSHYATAIKGKNTLQDSQILDSAEHAAQVGADSFRSEERRVGKQSRGRWVQYDNKKMM